MHTLTEFKRTFCAPGEHTFCAGGVRKDMPAKYIGKECCGGEKLAGDLYGKQWKCKQCPYKGYVCGKCRKEIPLTDEQKAVVEKKKEAAAAAKRGRPSSEPTPFVMAKIVRSINDATKRARLGELTEEEELDAVMATIEREHPPPC